MRRPPREGSRSRSIVRLLGAVLLGLAGIVPCVAAAEPAPEPVCGDGILEPPEECDDGNGAGADGCDRNCRLPWAFVVAGQSNAEGRSTWNGDVVGFPGVTSPDPLTGLVSRTLRSRYLFDTGAGFPTWVAANDWPCADSQCTDRAGTCALRTKDTHGALDPNCECHCGNTTDVDAGTETLSAWPIFAQRIMQDVGREVELISVNRGSTSLVAGGGPDPGAPLWDSTVDCSARLWSTPTAWTDERGDLYCLLLHAVEQSGVGDRLQAVLWYQGEADGSAAVPKETYEAALERLADDVWLQLGVPMIAAPISLCQYPDDPCRTVGPERAAIHDATEEAIADHPHLFMGPDTDDLEHLDVSHVQDVVTLGERWAAAVQAVLIPPAPACSNGVDDDADGLTDFPADPGCGSGADTSESPACDDGIDNDGDSLVDFPADPACASGWGASESSRCQDGIDNDDGDGLIDFDGGASHNGGVPLTAPDPQCVGKPYRNREVPDACGLGAELALLLGAIGARATRPRPLPLASQRTSIILLLPRRKP